MARPRKEVDWEKASKLAIIFCTAEEIANILGISFHTLDRRSLEEHGVRFAKWAKQFSDQGRASLRRTQYTKAINGNVPLLIWLGKNELNQTDKTEIEGNIRVESITDMLEKSETRQLLDVTPKEIEGDEDIKLMMPEPGEDE